MAGSLQTAALAFAAGCGPEFLAASEPADIAIYRAIAEEGVETRDQERSALARDIRNEIANLLG